jgi:hypothetical protein
MLVSYGLSARTADDQTINGHVMLRPDPDLGSGVQFQVAACLIACGDQIICQCGEAGFLRFLDGPEPGGVVIAGADWALGPWANAGTGVWFLHADGTPYPSSEDGFGLKDAYRILAPRIELCADLAEQGPFHAVDTITLTLAV